MLKRGNFCSAGEAREFYDRCLYEENKLGIEWVHDACTLPLVSDPENVPRDIFPQSDYDLHNISRDELAIRASFLLMPDSVKLRVREGNILSTPKLLRDYNLEQIDWMKRASQFLAQRTKQDPQALELVHEYFSNGTPVYFKIREVILFPERFVKDSPVLKLSELLHGGISVQRRLYGDPDLVPRKITLPTAA